MEPLLKVELDASEEKPLILIAEDNDSNYRLFESILHRSYSLTHAWNGQEAVEMFQHQEPRIILMDINMPVMNGYEATAEIRKFSTTIPIVAVTAYAFASDEQRVMESGFDGYIAKPVNPKQLRDRIAEILARRA